MTRRLSFSAFYIVLGLLMVLEPNPAVGYALLVLGVLTALAAVEDPLRRAWRRRRRSLGTR